MENEIKEEKPVDLEDPNFGRYIGEAKRIFTNNKKEIIQTDKIEKEENKLFKEDFQLFKMVQAKKELDKNIIKHIERKLQEYRFPLMTIDEFNKQEEYCQTYNTPEGKGCDGCYGEKGVCADELRGRGIMFYTCNECGKEFAGLKRDGYTDCPDEDCCGCLEDIT